jgi:PKD repeat protein
MTESGRKLAALGVVVVLAVASFGYTATDSTTTGLFADTEVANAAIEMPERPVASVGNTATVDEGEPVSLSGGSSSDDTEISTYEWDFDGDGTVEKTGVNPRYTYSEPGTYTVTLTVTDTAGLTDSATTTVTVRNVAPTARAGPDRSVGVRESISFDAAASDHPGGDDLHYEWEFGDNHTIETDEPAVEHRYSAPGRYTVAVRVSDGDGGTDTDTVTLTVESDTKHPVGTNTTAATTESDT